MKASQTLTFSATVRPIERYTQTKSKLFVFIEGENVLENMQNRMSRPVAEYRKLLAPIFQMLGVEKAMWSQHAGCRMCPCSPGFVLDRRVHIDDFYLGNDIYITIKGGPKHNGNPREISFA